MEAWGTASALHFHQVRGRVRETALAAAQECVALLEGKDAAHWRTLSKLIHSMYYSQTTVCAGIEMALLDALTRSYGIPLYVFFGGAGTHVETDISIPLVAPEHAKTLARDIVQARRDEH